MDVGEQLTIKQSEQVSDFLVGMIDELRQSISQQIKKQMEEAMMPKKKKKAEEQESSDDEEAGSKGDGYTVMPGGRVQRRRARRGANAMEDTLDRAPATKRSGEDQGQEEMEARIAQKEVAPASAVAVPGVTA